MAQLRRTRKKPTSQTWSSSKRTIILPSKLAALNKVEPFLEKLNKVLHLAETQFHKLVVATTEAVSNAIIHGNKRDANKTVSLICECKQRPARVVIRVKDAGTGFDPESVPSPLRKERLLEANGRGVFLMRRLMDGVQFKFTKRGGEVIMSLHLE